MDVFGAGNNALGQLVDERLCVEYPSQLAVRATGAVGDIAGLAAGRAHSVFLTQHGTVLTAGSDVHGQLGVPPTKPASSGSASASTSTTAETPQAHATHIVSKLASKHIVAVAAGADSTYAVDRSGGLYAWGGGRHGCLGIGGSVDRPGPRQVRALVGHTVKQVAAGQHHVALFTSTGEVFVWGKNTHGQLGLGDTTDRDVPTQLPYLLDCSPVMLTAGKDHTAMVTETMNKDLLQVRQPLMEPARVLFTWGDNSRGQLGVGRGAVFSSWWVDASLKFGEEAPPEQPTKLTAESLLEYVRTKAKNREKGALQQKLASTFVTDISKQPEPTYAASSSNPALAQCALVPQLVPRISVDLYTVDVAAGGQHTLALCRSPMDYTETVVYAWGANTYGELGVGDSSDRPRPVEVKMLHHLDVRQLHAGLHVSVAVTSVGKVFSWGNSDHGEAGFGLKISCMHPQLCDHLCDTNIQVQTVAVGHTHTLFGGISLTKMMALRSGEVLKAMTRAGGGFQASSRPATDGGTRRRPSGRPGSASTTGSSAFTFAGADAAEATAADTLLSKPEPFQIPKAEHCTTWNGPEHLLRAAALHLRYTCSVCRLDAICRACAHKCHASHHVKVLVNPVPFKCACGSSDGCHAVPPESSMGDSELF